MPLTGLDALLGLAAAWYLVAARRARFAAWRAAMGVGGFAAIAVALCGPLDELADRLLAAHMLQHLLLMFGAAPLLVIGRPLHAAVHLLSERGRRALGRALHWPGAHALRAGFLRPAVAWMFFCGGLAFWHLPRVYRWALAAESHHLLMHGCFFASGCAFWSVLRRTGSPGGLDHGRAILYVLSAALVTGLPGAVLAFAGRLVYPQVAPLPLPFGLTPLADQQLAGLIMWIPMDLALFGVAAWLFAAWIKDGAASPARAR